MCWFDRLAGGMPAAAGGRHLREILPAMRALWQGDDAHDGEIWQFPTSTSNRYYGTFDA